LFPTTNTLKWLHSNPTEIEERTVNTHIELFLFGDNQYSAGKNTNQCKDARALKEPEGCRVDAPQQLN